jgi:hypothetical protein
MRWQLWSDFLESVRTGQSAVERAFGQSVFQRLAANAEEAALFNQAMESFSAALSAPVIAAYNFAAFRQIADVGGGTGRFLADLLTAHPHLQGLLYDLPKVVTAAPPLLETSRVGGADAYLLKQVIHDWDDARATAILASCRRAMAPTAKLLIVERVMPEKAQHGQAAEAYLLDLEMLVLTPGGRERSKAEFDKILAAAGLAMTRAIPTTASVSVIEAQPI